MTDDADLLRQYAHHGDHAAFAELVQRHVDLVYSAAVRQLNGDAHLAADATQIVFTDLARKAAALSRHRVLAGWLFTSTRFVCAKLVRGAQRRQIREQEAQLMHDLNEENSAALDWDQVRPVLDAAMAELGEDDREAILLRFFEGRDYASVGARLAVADNTARMRVERALDRLRRLLARRGVRSTQAALAVGLAQQAVAAAPLGLAATVAGGIAAAATAGLIGTSAGIFMSMTKLQVGIAATVAFTSAAGYVLQARANADLQGELTALRRQNEQIEILRGENVQLARTEIEVRDMLADDAEFARLQEEAGVLRSRLQKIAAAERARAAAATRGQVYELAQLDRTPVPKFQARPQYPAELRAAGVTGEVVVGFIVDTLGEVQDVRAVRSTHAGFESAAIAAVSKWKFQPGQKGGGAVPTRLHVPMVFSLNGEKAAATAAPKPPENTAAAGPGSNPATVRTVPFVTTSDRD